MCVFFKKKKHTKKKKHHNLFNSFYSMSTETKRITSNAYTGAVSTLLVVGGSGMGKSSFLNWLSSGRTTFVTGVSPLAVTKQHEMTHIRPLRIRLIDTVGLGDVGEPTHVQVAHSLEKVMAEEIVQSLFGPPQLHEPLLQEREDILNARSHRFSLDVLDLHEMEWLWLRQRRASHLKLLSAEIEKSGSNFESFLNHAKNCGHGTLIQRISERLHVHPVHSASYTLSSPLDTVLDSAQHRAWLTMLLESNKPGSIFNSRESDTVSSPLPSPSFSSTDKRTETGIQLVAFVFDISKRFTPAVFSYWTTILHYMGPKLLEHAVVIFTHADAFDTVEERRRWLTEFRCQPEGKTLLSHCNDRHFFVDCRTSRYSVPDSSRDAILRMLRAMPGAYSYKDWSNRKMMIAAEVKRKEEVEAKTKAEEEERKAILQAEIEAAKAVIATPPPPPHPNYPPSFWNPDGTINSQRFQACIVHPEKIDCSRMRRL